ncbi:MAG: DUF342 domain-containing protein, partial [Spirochaetales bacterium]|nr:DUF342 domain-containing protein [Spirochaetales bacterium]
PEEAEWVELTTPPEFKPFEASCIAEAAPPALFRVRVDKVARERIVKKPGALPFLPGKEEKIVEYEKIEVRERVQVDTKVRSSFWVAKGTLAGRLVAARAGKAGKNVYGKTIPPGQDDDPTFHLGSGLSRGKGEIVAEASGFIRRGTRWADLIPFKAGEYSIRLSDDTATVLLDYSPGDKRLPPPDAAAILQEAVELGQPVEGLLTIDEVASALLKATRSGQALTGFSLSCDRDASVRINVSPDKLSASLTIVKGRGKGKLLELSMVSAALAEHKLKGVKIDKLKTDVIAFYKGSTTELEDYPLATGKEPVKGKDRTLLFGVAFLPEEQGQDYITTLGASPGLARVAKTLDEFPLALADRVALVKKDQEVARFSTPSFGQPGTDVYGAAIPATPGNDPAINIFENLRISRETIESEEDGILLLADKDGVTLARVLPYRDARVDVSVAEDAMSARITVERSYGLGRELTLEYAQEALKEAGVVGGIDLKELSEALADAREGRKAENRVIAHGKAPVPAGGYRIQWIIRMASGAALTLRADGTADYKNQDRSTVVVEGQPILELLSIGVEGQDGQDVLGSVVPAPVDPRVAEPPTFDDSLLEEKLENGDRIIKAAKNGILQFDKNRLSIDPAHKVNGDVGPATGNIQFPGPVAISGTVLSGYAIVAGGDVLIAGSVEAALVTSDGTIRITEGIKGAKKGTVRARKGIEAAFAEQAMLLGVEDITLKNSALLCNIKSNGKVALQGDKGHLIGGLCRARKGIEVQNLGSESGAKTQISFGQDYLVKDAIEAEEREIERVKSMILLADKRMREIEKEGGSLDAIRQEKLKLVKLLEKRSMRVFELREKFEEHFPGEIVIRGSVFAGVVLESHNRFHEIRQTKQRVAFSFDPQLGRIIERPLK